MSQSKISISTASAEDFHAIATLESHTFHDEPFSIVAFGSLRSSPSNISRRAIQFNTINPLNRHGQLKIGEWNVVHKAVDENGHIVGAAVWTFVTERERKKNEDVNGLRKEEWKQEEWGETANRRFCEEVFLRGDEIMVESTKGLDYASGFF